MNKVLTTGGIIIALVLSIIGLVQNDTKTVVEKPSGALAGPDIPYRDVCIGGVCSHYEQQPLAATSSVICSIPIPTATSTLAAFNMTVTGNNLVAAQTLDVSTSTSQFAQIAGNYGSSTPAYIFAASLPAAGQKSFFWRSGNSSTTNSKAWGSDTLFNTGEALIVSSTTQTYLNVRIATGTPGTWASGNYLTGSCSAKFDYERI